MTVCDHHTTTDAPVTTDAPTANILSTHERLVLEQERTLAAPRRRPTPIAATLFVTMDLFYGRRRTLQKFLVLELIARVPYQTWEHAAYIKITRNARHTQLARRIYDRVCRAREQQDNEQWHLFILEDTLEHRQQHLGWYRFRLLPQVIALTYYAVSWMLYVVRPAWSYRLNADFEDHAEHEYAAFVAEHPSSSTSAARAPSQLTTESSTAWPTCCARSPSTSGTTRTRASMTSIANWRAARRATTTGARRRAHAADRTHPDERLPPKWSSHEPSPLIPHVVDRQAGRALLRLVARRRRPRRYCGLR